MRRIERKLFEVNDQIARLREEAELVEAELSALRAIDDDAQRDAALGYDRLEATATRDEVRRFEALRADLDRRRRRLERRRARLLSQLSPGE